MGNQFSGIGILWGFPGAATQTLTGLGVMSQLQTMEFTRKAEREKIKDGTGNTSARCYSDHEDGAVIDFIPTSGTNTGTLTVASLPSVGSTLTFTDAQFTPITAIFCLDDLSVSRANTKAMMAKLTVSRDVNNSIPG